MESKNIICLVTNQAQEALGVMGDNIRPVGGNVIGHTFTHRIYLKKPQSMSKDKITAILVDSVQTRQRMKLFWNLVQKEYKNQQFSYTY